MNTGIYLIINKLTNEYYLGSSSDDFHNRFRSHMYNLRKNKHHSYKLQKLYNRHGLNILKFHILEYVEPSKCLEIEQFYLKNLNPKYNISKDANSPMKGRKHSDKTKIKMSGKIPWNVGIPRTEEEKALMSLRKKENYKKLTDDQKSQRSINYIKIMGDRLGKTFLGKHHNNSSKAKLRKAHINKNDLIVCNETGKIFEAQLDIARSMKLRQGHISEHLQGKRKNVKGFTFSRIKKNS